MSNFILGITTRNIKNALWNGFSENSMLFGGMAAAMAENAVSQALLYYYFFDCNRCFYK